MPSARGKGQYILSGAKGSSVEKTMSDAAAKKAVREKKAVFRDRNQMKKLKD